MHPARSERGEVCKTAECTPCEHDIATLQGGHGTRQSRPSPAVHGSALRPHPSYAPGSVKTGIHANPGSKSSLHLLGTVEPFEPPRKREPEPLEQRHLLCLGLRHMPQSYRGVDAAG